MPVTSLAVAQFSAGHTAPCGDGNHGHAFTVRIEMAARHTNSEPASEAVLMKVHRDALVDILAEVHLRNLDAYLPGADTSPGGLALYFRERLTDPAISAIEVVTMDGQGARVEFARR